MAESLNEVSSSVDVLEAGDNGKKKSKFKAFKNFFGKKKKKESEDAPGGRTLKSSLSNSNIDTTFLKPVEESQPTEARVKSNMGNKAVSHDSIFMLDPESERSASKMYTSMDSQRGRPLQRSLISRTLPRTGDSNVHAAISGAMFGAVPQYAPRSGVWVAGSKITEIPPLRPRQPSISPPLIRSGTISKDFEEISIDDEAPNNQQRTSSTHKILTAKKNFSEPSTGTDHSPSSSACTTPIIAQQPVGFSVPATAQGCLDSTAARHKMALNPRKQKKKKSLQGSVKIKQEEPILSLISEGEKSPNKPEEIDQMKLKKDSAGPLIQEHSNKTETDDQKTADQILSTEASGSPSFPVLAVYGRRRRRKGSSISGTPEYGSRGRCAVPSNQGHGLDDTVESTPTDKTASDFTFRHLSLEEQVMEQLTSPKAETTTSQELLSDQGDMGRKSAGIDFKIKRASAPQPILEDMIESMMNSPSLYHENEFYGAKKIETRVSLLPMVGRISKTQEEAILSVASEAQLLTDPSHTSSEEEETSSQGLQNTQTKMELAQDVLNISKEKSGNVLQAFIPSSPDMTDTIAEINVSTEGLSLRRFSQSLGKPEDKEVSSNSRSTSEEGSDPEEEITPEHSLQSSQKPEDDEELFPESESSTVELGSLEQHQLPSYSLQFLRKPQTEKVSSNSESASEEERGSEELAADPFSQSFGKLEEVVSESKNFATSSVSEEQLAVEEPEDTDVSTESNSYVEKCNSAEDWSSVEEDEPVRRSDRVVRKSKDRRVSKNIYKDWRFSAKRIHSRHPSKPTVQHQASSRSVSISAGHSNSKQVITPSCPLQPSVSPKCGQQRPPAPGSTASEWGISVEPLPPRKTSKRLMKSKIELNISPYTEITTREDVVLPPECPSEPSVRPTVENQVSLGTESATVAGDVSMEPLPPKHQSQPLMRSLVQQQVSADPRSMAVEEGTSMDLRPPAQAFQPCLNPLVEQETSSFPESKAVEGPPKSLSKPLINSKVQQNMSSGSEGVTAMEPLYPKNSPQSTINHKVQQIPSESTAVEPGITMELLSPGCPSQPLMKPQLQPQKTVDSVNISSQWSGPVEPVPARHTFQPLINPEFKHQTSARGSENIEAEGSISKESVPPKRPLQPRLLSIFEPASASAEASAAERGVPVASPLPNMPSQPPTKFVTKQAVSAGLASASAQWSTSVQSTPPRHPVKQRLSSTFEQQVSAGPENSAVEGSVSAELRPPGQHSQIQMKTIIKKEVSSGSVSTSTEWSCQVPSRYGYQPCGNPKFERQVSTGSESATIEGRGSRDVLFSQHHSLSTIKQKVQKRSSSFESATVEEGISGRSLPPMYPTQFSVRSKVQEMSSRLENSAVEEDFSKKPLLPSPSQTFVKYMAQQIFSENPAVQGGICADRLSPNHPSKPKKLECQVTPDRENADSEVSISSKRLSIKHRFQSLGKLEGTQEGLSYSENVPGKWSSSKGQAPTRQISHAQGKFEYRQEVSSVSDGSLKEWRSSEKQLSFTHSSQTWDESEFRPPILSGGPVNVPEGWSRAEELLPPRHPFQAFENAKYQQQAYSGSKSATAKGTIFENHPGTWSLPKGSVSPKKHNQVSEDFVKSIPASATKPGKMAITSIGKTSISRSTYFKEEVIQSTTGNNDGLSNLPTNEAEVENIFGVRLKRISSPQKLKSENQDNLTQPPSVPVGPVIHSLGKEQRMRRSNPQVFLSSTDDVTDIFNFTEKQQSEPKSEVVPKRQLSYKFSGKPSFQQSDCDTSEPVWITMAKQRQKGFLTYVPVKELKSKRRTGAKAETMEIKYEGIGPENETQAKKILTSTLRKQEKTSEMKPPKPVKSVAFEDQKILLTPTMEKETKRSSNLPVGLQQPVEPAKPVEPVESKEPVEPIWFSMAKKKAKAWSHIADTMQ